MGPLNEGWSEARPDEEEERRTVSRHPSFSEARRGRRREEGKGAMRVGVRVRVRVRVGVRMGVRVAMRMKEGMRVRVGMGIPCSPHALSSRGPWIGTSSLDTILVCPFALHGLTIEPDSLFRMP